MPWEPAPPMTPEARIEHDARCLQLHDPDEIRARYWHTNMRIRRVVFSILWLFAAVITYTTVPILIRKLLQ
jgi:hypothetical protein